MVYYSLKNYARSENGATLVEYSLLLSMLLCFVLFVVQLVGVRTADVFSDVGETLAYNLPPADSSNGDPGLPPIDPDDPPIDDIDDDTDPTDNTDDVSGGDGGPCLSTRCITFDDSSAPTADEEALDAIPVDMQFANNTNSADGGSSGTLHMAPGSDGDSSGGADGGSESTTSEQNTGLSLLDVVGGNND